MGKTYHFNPPLSIDDFSLTLRMNTFIISSYSYPREKSQGVAFEQTIAPVDLIISLECKPVNVFPTNKCKYLLFIVNILVSFTGNNGITYFETSIRIG